MNEIYGSLIRNCLRYWLIKRFVIVLKYIYILNNDWVYKVYLSFGYFNKK